MDQAAGLRQLVMRTVEDASSLGSMRLLVMSGGKGGVGVTTLAVNLAAALARQASRTVLLDARLYRGDVAAMCGLEERGSVADVLAGRRDIHEVLQPGPDGLRIVPGLWAPRSQVEFRPAAQQRLLRQIRQLADVADVVVVDAGNGGSEVVRRFWEAADDVVLVTTGDPISVMDTYATLKRLAEAPIQLLVNRVEDECSARDVHRRIDSSARRFLGFGVESLGYVPADRDIEAATAAGLPLLLHSPECPAAHAFARIASRVTARKSLAGTGTSNLQPAAGRSGDFGKTIELQPSFSPIV